MKIGIVGGGITGLTAAYELTKLGHKVEIFEKAETLGGLASGYKKPGWNWSLEKTYHHLFTNDSAIISFVKELKIESSLIIKRPITANYTSSGALYPFDSISGLLKYPILSIKDKLQTGLLLGILKSYPFWQSFENISAKKLIRFIGGDLAWQKIWEPLFISKFGSYLENVPASWFWARIQKRTPRLVYFKGGFQTFINTLTQKIEQQSGKIHTNYNIDTIQNHHSKFTIYQQTFDTILITIPSPLVAKIMPQLSRSYINQITDIPHLQAQTLILETTKPILNHIYWVNITDRSFPFLAVVAHTNFMDSSKYANHHMTYFGNYLEANHPYLSMTKHNLLKKFKPFIMKINPNIDLKKILVDLDMFTGYFAQPVHSLNYSKKAPKIETPIPGLFLANMDSIFPWDRGTNYAVELGRNAAQKINKS